MDPKKDKFKGFKELKKIAAERLVRILSNKLFVDIRKVRRFRIWQSEYLDHVMAGISQKNTEKQMKLKLRYLQFLSFILQKHLRASLYTWIQVLRASKSFSLPRSKLLASIKIIAISMIRQNKAQNIKNFAIASANSASWRPCKVKLALFSWKRWVVSELLAESHREMAGVRLVHFLRKKTAPLMSFALRKFFFRTDKKVSICALVVLVRDWTVRRKHFAFMKLAKKKNVFTPAGRPGRDLKFKVNMLKKIVGIRKMNLIVAQRKEKRTFGIGKDAFFYLVKCFIVWKSIRRVKRRLGRRPKATNRRIKNMGLRFIISKLKEKTLNKLSSSLSRWRSSGKKSKLFEIDKFVIINQAQVSVHIEAQILKKENDIKAIKKLTSLSNLVLCSLKRLKQYFNTWAEILTFDESRTNDRDIVYEYIRFLEDNLGVPHRFRN